MLAGSKCTGKTTFLNSLFGIKLIDPDEPQSIKNNLMINKFEIIENGFKLKLQVIETCNYGVLVDNSLCWQPACDYITRQHEKFLKQSQKLLDIKIEDTRVHCCIYFINPTVGSIAEFDIQAMKNLTKKVNLIPVIAKSDSLNDKEIFNFKKLLKTTLIESNIQICPFIKILNPRMLKMKIDSVIPFSIVSSIDFFENAHGDLVKARKYPWGGLVEIENESHCEFTKLKKVIFDENMIDFIMATELLYEQFRYDYLMTKLDMNQNTDRNVQNSKSEYEKYVLEKEKKLANMINHLYQVQEELKKDLANLNKQKKSLQICVNELESNINNYNQDENEMIE